jgi:tetrahydromethanopterin S-methyltransferase subunit G
LGVVAEAMLSRVLEEAVNRIARKVAEGKKLSDQEIVILYLDIIMRSNEKRFEAIDKRFNDLREYTDKKFESIDRRFGELREYVDKKVNDLKDYVDKRFESLERRVDLVYSEVSSIKTDIIKIMEGIYGEAIRREKGLGTIAFKKELRAKLTFSPPF